MENKKFKTMQEGLEDYLDKNKATEYINSFDLEQVKKYNDNIIYEQHTNEMYETHLDYSAKT